MRAAHVVAEELVNGRGRRQQLAADVLEELAILLYPGDDVSQHRLQSQLCR